MRRPIIRFATSNDTKAIVEIITRVGVGEHHIHDGDVSDMLLENVLIGELDGKVAGFLFWIHGRRHAYVDTLAIAPEYQNEGVGAWLMHELGFLLNSLKIKHLYAVTHPDYGKGVRDMLIRLGYTNMGSVIAVQKSLNGGGLYG